VKLIYPNKKDKNVKKQNNFPPDKKYSLYILKGTPPDF
jgi:hypothetical protein